MEVSLDLSTSSDNNSESNDNGVVESSLDDKLLVRKDTLDNVINEVIEQPEKIHTHETMDESDNSDTTEVEEKSNTINPTEQPTASEALIIPIDAPDGKLKETPKSNTFAAKKTVAQGMMDIALITANANQLRYLIEFNSNSVTFYLNVVLIIISLVLQVAVGLALIFKTKLDKSNDTKMTKQKINQCIVVGVFLVTIINVFIASFTITNNKNINNNVIQSNNVIAPNVGN